MSWEEITSKTKFPTDRVFYISRRAQYTINENEIEIIGLMSYANYFFQVSPFNLYNRFTEKEIKENYTHYKPIE